MSAIQGSGVEGCPLYSSSDSRLYVLSRYDTPHFIGHLV